ncbi:MAG: hypothetical protein JJ863_21780 [Deltaproteobacteria bacterium]|nr:hypothetical protein [Deltaproteobacteria bacterium]
MDWTPQIAFADDDLAIGYAGPMVAHFWTRKLTASALRRLRRVIEIREEHGPLAMLVVVSAGAVVPSPAAREPVAAYLDDVGGSLELSALLLEGPAMQSAAFRGVDMGLTLLAERDYPHAAFDALGAAAEWMVEHAPGRWGLTVSRVESAVEELRELAPR